jgi:hypothetical protein
MDLENVGDYEVVQKHIEMMRAFLYRLHDDPATGSEIEAVIKKYCTVNKIDEGDGAVTIVREVLAGDLTADDALDLLDETWGGTSTIDDEDE